MALGDYPSWMYDPLGINPPQLVLTDPTFQAALAATDPTASAVQTTAPVSISTVVTTATALVVTQGRRIPAQPRLPRWAKTPTVEDKKRST